MPSRKPLLPDYNVARNHSALVLAIVDGERRLSYAAWYGEIGRVTGGLAALGLGRRDRLALTDVAVISATLSGSRRLALPPRAGSGF